MKSSNSFVMQGDCPSAYLNAKLKDILEEVVYLYLPEGHPEKNKNDLVYMCPSALYGLAISGRAWYYHFVKVVRKFGLRPSRRSPCLFTYEQDEKLLTLQLYVDDFLFGSTDINLMESFMKFLEKELQVKSTNEIKKFVGFEMNKHLKNLELHQRNMIDELGQEYEITKAERTPMIENLKWKEDSKPLEDIKKLQKLHGELSYISNLSRPDVAFAVNKICDC